MKERTCYNCKYSKYCFLKYNFQDIIDKGISIGFLNISSPENAPKGFTDLYTTLAECCIEYKENENV